MRSNWKNLWLAGGLMLVSCADVDGDAGDFASEQELEVAQTDQALVGGTTTSARAEVGTFNGCTATLIAPNVIITAAQCVDFTAYAVDGGNKGNFTINGQGFRVSGWTSFDNKLGRYDVALGYLAEPGVPGNVAVPARIAARPPGAGALVTTVGFGCNDRNTRAGTGTKRYRQYNWGSATRNVCGADVGGPIFEGGINAGGRLVGLNSGLKAGAPTALDVVADVTGLKTLIEDRVRAAYLNLLEPWDRPGLNLRALTTTDFAQCSRECFKDAQCRTVSYVESSKTCYLKYGWAEVAPSPSSKVLSGPPNNPGNVNLVGMDYASFPSIDTFECKGFCAADGARCASYTLFNGTCWLKSGIPAQSACTGCTSGINRGLENNVNRQGGDYLSVKTSTARACAERCATEDRCLSFTWVDADDTCWLKDGAMPASFFPGVTSGLRHGLEFDIDRPGDDYRSFAIDGPVPYKCQAACAREAQCKGWTLVTAPAGGENRCWLKRVYRPGRSSLIGAISGSKFGEFF